MQKIISASLLLVSVLLACNTKDKQQKKTGDSEAVYLDYKIIGAEDNDNVAIALQFRENDENGDAMSLTSPSSITVDGEVLQKDSSKHSGVVYELFKPTESFTGLHNISYMSVTGKKHNQEINFTPLQLLTPLANVLSRDSLVLEVSGLGENDKLRVILTDTAFESEGINQLTEVVNNRIFISKSDLQTVKNGPVQLELVREYEQPIENATNPGGKLLMIYSLRRQFVLDN